MCGIFGILSKNNMVNIQTVILQALNLLKNRGYDSCGVYLDNLTTSVMCKYGMDDTINQDIFVLLEQYLMSCDTGSNMTRGIGHTRWATHGKKTNINAHPHVSPTGRYVIVHNGIISNYNELKTKYLSHYVFQSATDSEVIVYMIDYLITTAGDTGNMMDILSQLDQIMEGTWACLIIDCYDKNKIYFMKNENPLLIGENEHNIIFTSEPVGFLNSVDSYTLLREHCYGYYDINGQQLIQGQHIQLPLLKVSYDDFDKGSYIHWMQKEIMEQAQLNVLIDPITHQKRYNQDQILFDFPWIQSTKYLYLIGCGSSYYAGLIASNYFRQTKAFEFVNVYDGAEFSVEHLEAIEHPEDDLLVVMISQSGETRDLNLATSICRNFSKHIKIMGIINVIGSLISRRTIDNIYTNCGRENAVASTKSCTAQILALLLLSMYKSKLCGRLDSQMAQQFIHDLNTLETNLHEIYTLEEHITQVAHNILASGHNNMFILGRDDLHGVALE